MSRLRTAVALLFHVLLLHASVLGGGMACAPVWSGVIAATPEAAATHAATHASHGAPTHAEHAGHAGQAHHVDADQAAADQAGADGRHTSSSDRAPTHCATAAGCAVAALATPSATDDALHLVRSAAEVGRVSLPPSIRPAPETPPPRA